MFSAKRIILIVLLLLLALMISSFVQLFGTPQDFLFLPELLRENPSYTLPKVVELKESIEIYENYLETNSATEEEKEIIKRLTQRYSLDSVEDKMSYLDSRYKQELKSFINDVFVHLLVVLIFAFIIFLMLALPRRCKYCKKWFAFKKVGGKNFVKTIPATFSTVIDEYNTDYKCKYCGSSMTIIQQKERRI